MDINLNVYEILWTEEDPGMTDFIDISENFQFYFDVLNLNVYDSIDSLYDDNEMVDTITVSEFIAVQNSDSLSISVFDEISATEQSTVARVPRFSVFQLFTVTEFVSASMVSVVDKFDDVTATEFLDMMMISQIMVFEYLYLGEPGMTYDDITVSEFVNANVGNLSIEFYDESTVVEFTYQYLNVLYASVFDISSVSENASLYLSELFVSVFDLATITEANNQYLDFLNVSVLDTASISEEATQSIDVLQLYVLEPFNTLVTEHVDVVDLVVEVGVVMEAISVLDYSETYLDVLNLSVFDASSVAEFASEYLDVLNISVFDTVTTTENASTYVEINASVFDSITIAEYSSFVLELKEIVFDNLTASEYSELSISLALSVFDNVTLAEFTSEYIDILNVSVLEPFNVLITEHVDVVDLVVEVGVVMEAISIIDYSEVSLNVLNISVIDIASVLEFAYEYIDVLNIAINVGNIDLLLHFDSQSGGKFIDSGKYGFSVKTTDVSLNTGTTVFGSGSAQWGSDADANLEIDDVDGVFAGERDFSFEQRVYFPTSVGNIGLMQIKKDASNYFDFWIQDPSTIRAQLFVAGVQKLNLSLAVGLGTGQFFTIALSKSGHVYRVLLNGINAGSSTASSDFFSGATKVRLGYGNGNTFGSGNIMDEVYFKNNVADWVSSYTVKLVPYVGSIAESTFVIENTNQYLDVLNVSVFDSASIAEVFNPNMPIFTGVLFDSIAITEFKIAEELIFVSVFDSFSATENVELIVSLSVDVYDESVITENNQQYLNVLNVSVFDITTILEYRNQYLDVLNFVVLEPFNVLVTEHADVVDLVVEVGVVMEAISVLEYANVYLSVLNVSIFDALSVTDSVSLSVPILVSVFEAITTTEALTAYFEILYVSFSENVSCVEFKTVEVQILISVFDLITTVENVKIIDLVVELGIVFEGVTVTEFTAISQTIGINVFDLKTVIENFQAQIAISISVFDTASIADVGTVHDLVIELGPAVDLVTITESIAMLKDVSVNVADTITAIEQFLRNMPINFYVAEQKGISIVTVSGW